MFAVETEMAYPYPYGADDIHPDRDVLEDYPTSMGYDTMHRQAYTDHY